MQEVGDAGNGRQTDKGQADAVPLFVLRSIFSQEGIGSDDASD